MDERDHCCSTHLKDGDGTFNVAGTETFMKEVNLAECGLSYAVVAIMGPESSGLKQQKPAHAVGCKTIVLPTSPTQDSSICKEVLYCAKKASITHVLKVGCAQAISTMAWRIESYPKILLLHGWDAFCY